MTALIVAPGGFAGSYLFRREDVEAWLQAKHEDGAA